MSGFFSLDGPFYKFGSMLADIMILSLVWILFSIPLVTIGASTTALFYVTTRRISNREGYILRDFWSAFKSNLKKATLLWILLAALIGLIVYYFLNLTAMAEMMGSMFNVLFPAWIIILIELLLISVYLFPLTARFDMKFLQIIKSALFMANRHIFTSLTCVVLGLAIVLGVYLYPILFLVAMGLYAWLTSYLVIRVFKRYRPDMDKDPLLESLELDKNHGQGA